MTDRKVPVTLPAGGQGTGVEVQVDESTERWSEIRLTDGTVVRAKLSVVSGVRVEGEWDPQGNPTYLMNMTPVFAIVDVPEHLRKKIQ